LATQEIIARQGDGASWLVILGFSFEENIENRTISFAGFQVTEAEQEQKAEAERQFRSLRGCWAEDMEDADRMETASSDSY